MPKTEEGGDFKQRIEGFTCRVCQEPLEWRPHWSILDPKVPFWETNCEICNHKYEMTVCCVQIRGDWA